MKRKILLSLICALSLGSISQAMDRGFQGLIIPEEAEKAFQDGRGKPTLCSFAAKKGLLELLKRAHENGWKWNKDACSQAIEAEENSLSCLQYLHENGCPWDESACAIAAEVGNLDCLTYLHKNDCPWNALAYECAEKYGHKDCLQYLMDNGCPRPAELSDEEVDD